MVEEALGIRSTDRTQSFADDLHECLVATSARFSQVALELTEGLLYGVDVWGVGRQVDQLAAPPFDQLPDPLSLMRAQVVHHHHLALLQRGTQDLAQVGLEYRPVGRTLHYKRRSHAHLLANAREQRYVLAPVAGSLLVYPLAFSRPSVEGRQ